MMKAPIGKLILLVLLIPLQLLATNFVEKKSSDWSMLHITDGVDPATADTDFNTTWYNPTSGGYVGTTYDGLAFTGGLPSPFSYGGVNALTGGTVLTTPPSGLRYTSYFYKVIDAGNGAENIKLSLLADDGAFVYLNGQLIARAGVSDPDTFTKLSSLGNESDYSNLTIIDNATLKPGLNLLAISMHQTSSRSSDLGFDLELSGDPVLVDGNSSDWAILNTIDPAGDGYDPVTGYTSQAADADFDATWKNQTFGGYTGGAYDGPSFTTGQQAPFAYGNIDGIPSPNTVLTRPSTGSRHTEYFLKEIDGGITGFNMATFTILAVDGAFIYLNGNLVGVVGDLPNEASQDTWSKLTSSVGSETTFHTFTVKGSEIIQPGINLLAVSVHQQSTSSPDLGLSLKVIGQKIIVPAFERGPYLQSASHDRMTLRWRTTDESSSVVRYGDSPTNLTQIMASNDSVTDHIVTLTGLAAATHYYYQIESSNLSGTITQGAVADYYFKTYPAPETEAPTRLWVIGDSGTRNANQMNVYNAYRSRTGTAHTDAWLMLGDNAYNSGSDEEFQGAVFDAYPELLRNTTMWSCIGNHETYTSGGAPYIDIHSFPTAGECGGLPSGSERYYSFDHGNIHFVCLDSTASNASDLPGSGGMIDWLEADLQATDKDWIIAYFHHGPYTKGSHDSDGSSQHTIVRRYMTPLLESYGVDMVLSGHSHTYERSMLVNGHHSNMTADDSTSSTFNYSMHAIDNGNGSDLGSVDGSGKFVTDGGDGSYRKELGSTQSGTIYSICGASGKLGNWSGGYSDTVNPVPHPVFVVNLRAMGSMIINVDGNILNAQYLDDQNVVRDDFTIVKPASGSVQVASVSEVAPVGTSVATVNTSGSGTLDYSIIGGNEAAMFAIDSSTGEVTSLALFDFQMDKIYNLTIGVTDDGVAIDPVLVTVNVLSMGDSDMRTTPVITLNGVSTVQHELGTTYTDLGATADGGETVTISGTVDVNVVGSYILSYNVSDAAGNPATQVTRTVTVVGSSGGESFGDVVIYPNNSTTLIAQVTLEGEVAGSGDVVAIYVGSELRGKHEVIISDGVAWVSAQVQVRAAGGDETISFKVYDASTGVTHEKSTTSAVITAGGAVGSSASPLMIEMKDFETQTLNLKAGWNLVSFYVEADDMTPPIVFAPIEGKLLQIKNLTDSYDPNRPSFLNNLSSLSVKDGYWLKVSEDVSLDVEGSVLSGASINVKSGWNLVGYPRSSGEGVADELTSLGNTVVQIKDLGSSYDPSRLSFLNTLSTMAPGSGYWLNVDADGTWTVGTVVEISELRRSIAQTQPDHSPEEKAGPAWGEAIVYPNLGATVLAQVSIQGKPVAKGGVVGAFVGNELRGLQGVVWHNGISYVTLNVNLNGAESVSYRVWSPDDHNDYLVSGTMLLELGGVYGNPKLVKLNAVTVVSKPLQVFNVTSEPFGFSFNTTLGRSYTVEATGDLRRWKAVELFQGSGGEIRFTAKPTSSGGAPFFRVFVK
jgi:hypothetical protein